MQTAAWLKQGKGTATQFQSSRPILVGLLDPIYIYIYIHDFPLHLGQSFSCQAPQKTTQTKKASEVFRITKERTKTAPAMSLN